MLCKQKMAERLVTFVRNLTLICYCKQRRHFEFTVMWRIRAVALNFVIILKRCYGKQRHRFEFLPIWLIRALCLNLTRYYFKFGATVILNFRPLWRHAREF
jgi:hypothetical protein